MSRYRKIISFILLLVFGVLTTHQLIPHSHHVHDEVAEHHHDHSGHHDHHHHTDNHHGHDSEAQSSELAFILHDHSHAQETLDYLVMTTPSKSRMEVKPLLYADIQYLTHLFKVSLLCEDDLSDHPPPKIKTSDPSEVASLRGPPIAC
ncbi:MAG: hypothetical protein AAGC88_10485 [Bacteroidota bacterium]